MQKPLFCELIEESAAFKALYNDIKASKLSHAYMFISQDRLYMSLLTSLFCAGILADGDEQRAELVFCNKHSDLIRLPDEGKSTVLTADIDKLNFSLYYKPVYGSKKVYVIDYGETMNASCQNKLLKTLEEPPPSVIFIINTSVKAAMLPTVISRTKVIEPPPLKLNDLSSALEKAYPGNERIDLAVSVCGGSLERANNILTDKKYSSLFSTALSSLLNIKNSKSVLFSASQLLGYKDRLAEIFGFYELIFRDVMVFKEAGEDLVMLKSNLVQIREMAQNYSADACVNILASIAKANKRLQLYNNAASVADELLFSIAEIKAKYK